MRVRRVGRSPRVYLVAGFSRTAVYVFFFVVCYVCCLLSLAAAALSRRSAPHFALDGGGRGGGTGRERLKSRRSRLRERSLPLERVQVVGEQAFLPSSPPAIPRLPNIFRPPALILFCSSLSIALSAWQVRFAVGRRFSLGATEGSRKRASPEKTQSYDSLPHTHPEVNCRRRIGTSFSTGFGFPLFCFCLRRRR